MEKQPIVNNDAPITDTNKDGILQGKEIIAQLGREEEAGSMRTKNEHVHGVLDFLGMRADAQEYSRNLLKAQLAENPDAIREIQKIAAQNMAGILSNTPKVIVSDEFQETLKRDINSIKVDPEMPQDQKDVLLADMNKTNDYGKTFAKTFPKGVSIAPEDVTGILAHFAPMPIIIQTQPVPKKKGGEIEI